MLARCVWFCSYLCKVCSRVSSQALLLVLRTLSLSFPTNNPSSDSKAFLCWHCVLRLPNSSTLCFPFFDAKAWPQSQTDLFTCTTVLHCAHTFLRRIVHYGITLWAYTACSKSRDHITATYVLRRGIRKDCT